MSQVDALAKDLTALDQQLGEHLANDPAARCDQAGELRDQICALAEAICDLAEHHPDRPDIRDRCADGRMRCDRARRVVGERCD